MTSIVADSVVRTLKRQLVVAGINKCNGRDWWEYSPKTVRSAALLIIAFDFTRGVSVAVWRHFRRKKKN